jgi:hypothetical protein
MPPKRRWEVEGASVIGLARVRSRHFIGATATTKYAKHGKGTALMMAARQAAVISLVGCHKRYSI